MPDNIRRPEPFDYSDDLTAGRADLQADGHFFLDTLFDGCTVLDVGAGLGKSKERIKRNTVTTWDIDARLGEHCDIAGGSMPVGTWDVVTAFDVIEHVQDDVEFLVQMYSRARLGVFVTTPNWHITHCNEAKGGSTHHWREYTKKELHRLLWRTRKYVGAGRDLVFAGYKDAAGSWWEAPVSRPDDASRFQARRFGVLMLALKGLEEGHWERVRELMKAGAQPERTPG